MGNKRKPVKRSTRCSYKQQGKQLSENERKRKGKNINEIVQTSPKRPRLVNNEMNENAENYDITYYHELETVAPNTPVLLTNIEENRERMAPDYGLDVHSSNQVQQADLSNTQTAKSTPDYTVGRRIINVSHFFEKLREISNHGPLDCGLSCIELVGEKIHGLSSKFTFRCKMCRLRFVIDSDSNNCMPINSCAVAATISIGCGNSQLQEFLAGLNLPAVSQKTYQNNHKLLSENWQQLAQQSMDQAAEEERTMAIAEGKLSKNGTPIIDVIADGVYGKRSYKKNYSALSGAAAIIGRKSGKILYLGVRNKYCYHCDRAEKKKTTPPEHFCSKNYSGPSTGMESDIIVEGFKQSLATHGLIYGRLISDGDSNTYSKILIARPYTDVTVEKVECRNHLLRNFCNKMQLLQIDTKYLKNHRKLLTTSRILSIRACIKKAIKKNKNDPCPEEQYLYDDILLALQHAFGNHLKCKSYFCDKIGKLDQDDVPSDFQLSSLWQRINIMIQGIAGHARSLLHDVDSNVVERYHSIIAKYVGGKRINFSLKNSYQTRCIASAVSFNEENSLSKLYKKISAKSPRGKLKMYEEKRQKEKLRSKRYPKKKRRLFFSRHNSDKNYGQECEKPDMPEEVLTKAKSDFLESLKKTDTERATIERKTILQRANGEWLEMRRSLLTASNFGRVIKRRANTPCANLVKDILYQKNLDNVKSISHGQHNEKTALAQLAMQEGIIIRPCGLFLDQELSFLGATPDGLTGEDTLIEVKCPLTANRIGLAAAIEQKKVNFWLKNKAGEIVVNKKHAWYYQAQGQLHVTQKRYCLFAVWESEKERLKTELIQRDDIFWEKEMKEKLMKFYIDCLLPEILDPRLSRNMKIREPYIRKKDEDTTDNKGENQAKNVTKDEEKNAGVIKNKNESDAKDNIDNKQKSATIKQNKKKSKVKEMERNPKRDLIDTSSNKDQSGIKDSSQNSEECDPNYFLTKDDEIREDNYLQQISIEQCLDFSKF